MDIVKKAKELGFELWQFDNLSEMPDVIATLTVNNKADKIGRFSSNKIITVKENLEPNHKRFLIASEIIYYLEHKDNDIITDMIHRG